MGSRGITGQNGVHLVREISRGGGTGVKGSAYSVSGGQGGVIRCRIGSTATFVGSTDDL